MHAVQRVFARALILTTVAVGAPLAASERVVAAPSACAAGTTAGDLNTRFAQGIGPLVGADYQRRFELPDGRRLWVFQDAFLRTPSGATRLVHNVGLIQSGRCFTVLHAGSAATRDRGSAARRPPRSSTGSGRSAAPSPPTGRSACSSPRWSSAGRDT